MDFNTIRVCAHFPTSFVHTVGNKSKWIGGGNRYKRSFAKYEIVTYTRL